MRYIPKLPIFQSLIVLTCLAALSALAREGGKQRDDGENSDRLDGAVVERLKRHFPELRILKVEDEKERGERVKKIRLLGDEKTDNVLVKISEDGEILWLDEDLDQNEVPDHIVRTLRKAFPNAAVQHVEKETRMEITYQFDIEQNGTKHEVVISRRGRISEVASRD